MQISCHSWNRSWTHEINFATELKPRLCHLRTCLFVNNPFGLIWNIPYSDSFFGFTLAVCTVQHLIVSDVTYWQYTHAGYNNSNPIWDFFHCDCKQQRSNKSTLWWKKISKYVEYLSRKNIHTWQSTCKAHWGLKYSTLAKAATLLTYVEYRQHKDETRNNHFHNGLQQSATKHLLHGKILSFAESLWHNSWQIQYIYTNAKISDNES